VFLAQLWPANTMNGILSTSYLSIPACYEHSGSGVTPGNPLIDALPLDANVQDALNRLSHFPPKPSFGERKSSELVRIAELARLGQLCIPLKAHNKASIQLNRLIRQAYERRNPFSVEDLQRRHLIALTDASSIPLAASPDDKALTLAILGVSGSGKSTFADAFGLPFNVVIEHRSYAGRSLNLRQIPWMKLRMPHDGTLKALCTQFFARVDSILGTTNYAQAARSVRLLRHIAPLMQQVVTAISLGVLVLDEFQNLRSARSEELHLLLEFLVTLSKVTGVAIVIIGTPAIDRVLPKRDRAELGLSTAGECGFAPLRGQGWKEFGDRYWEYQFVKNPGPLTPAIRAAWYRASAGNPGFASTSFVLAQRLEIGGREQLDAASFERVRYTEMVTLGPAVQALRRGDRRSLAEFDDLLPRSDAGSLMDFFTGVPRPNPEGKGPDAGEFEDFAAGVSTSSTKSRRSTAKDRVSHRN
jgi:hypothetical protein